MLTREAVAALPEEAQAALLAELEGMERDTRYDKLSTLFPDKGPLRRELYKKALEFFEYGKTYNERAFFGGNRSGKTVATCYEDALHLTGNYPNWWRGYRFDGPVDWWVAGDTAKTIRNILQSELLGKPGDEESKGTGMIPRSAILRTTPKHGLADAIESAFIRHSSGGVSTLQFLSYDQGRIAFQGTSQHGIHLDEDCPQDIYAECLLRLLTTQGIIYWSATLVEGLTPLMLDFLPSLRPAPEP